MSHFLACAHRNCRAVDMWMAHSSQGFLLRPKRRVGRHWKGQRLTLLVMSCLTMTPLVLGRVCTYP